MTDEAPKKPAPKWLENDNHDRYKRSKKHEDRLAKSMGGRRLPRSGGMAWSRHDRETAGADIGTPDLHIEHKRTDKQSMSLKKDWLRKVSKASTKVMKIPALILTFEEKGKNEDWICLPLDVAKRLLGIKVDD